MLVALAGLVAVLGVQARANGQLTAKNAELDVAFRREAEVRKEAQTNFDMALKAVDDYLTSVSENTLFKLQDSVDIRSLRQELLNSALKYYKSFVQPAKPDPLLRRQLADAYFRVGRDHPGSRITERRRSRLTTRRRPSGNRCSRPIPTTMNFKATWLQSYLADRQVAGHGSQPRSGRGDRSRSTRARAILEPLGGGNPARSRLPVEPGRMLYGDRNHPSSAETAGESLALLEKAKAIDQRLDRSDTRISTAYQKSLAEITNVLGYAYYKRDNIDGGARSRSRGPEHLPDRLEASDRRPQASLAVELAGLEPLQHRRRSIRKMGDSKMPSSRLSKSVDYRSVLVDSHPSVTDYQGEACGRCREIAGSSMSSIRTPRRSSRSSGPSTSFKTLVRAHPRTGGLS